MRSPQSTFLCGLLFVAGGLTVALADQDEPFVRLERVPDGGIQPRVAVDAEGVVHLVYFKGEPAHGDLFYCRRDIDDSEFSAPIRVNSGASSTIATGTIRGAQIAIGADQSVHVAWNGSSRARPAGPESETPLLYTRLIDLNEGFEPQRNLIDNAYGLDGGACIAADSNGNIYVAWHAGERSAGEAARRIWMVYSDDNGATFSPERAIDSVSVGACGCCGMQGTVAPDGEVMFLYRSAAELTQRDIYLLRSRDAEGRFESSQLDAWQVDTCPMSSESFVHVNGKAWAAWETDGQIFFADVSQSTQPPRLRSVAGSANSRKHPAMVANESGQVLIVWTEGTGWNQGGSLAWQRVDSDGQSTDIVGAAPGIPVWSFAAAYADAGGSFTILY